MNLKFFTFIALFCISLSTLAQSASSSQRRISWTGFETWSTNHAAKEVISFKNAQFPGNEDLPYFVEKFEKKDNAVYSFSVENPVFQNVTPEEKVYLSTKNIPTNISVSSYVSTDRGKDFSFVQVLPFVKTEEEIQKLVSFDLKVEKLPEPQKTPSSKHTFSNSSVLANGKFVKVKVVETGIYKITYESLKNMGVDPANVKVFGYGGALLEQSFLKPKIDDLPEVAIHMEKGADGVFNAGDYILFYGQGITKWSYDLEKQLFTHTLNHYANEGYYFITSDVGTGKKIQDYAVNVPADANVVNVTDFVDYQVHEVERINLGKTGKVFYGEDFTNKLTYNFPFSFPNLTNDNITVRIDVAAISSDNSSFDLMLGSQIKNIPISRLGADLYQIGKDANVTHTFTSPGTENVDFTLTYKKGNNASRGYLNYLEVSARRKLRMSGSTPLFFRNVDNLDSSKYNKFQILGANTNVQVWDITDPSNTKRVVTTRNGDLLEFIDSNEQIKQYVAIDPTAKNYLTMEPTPAGTVLNQNLHGLPQAEFVIITNPNFITQAEKLANAHREIDNMTVNVVTSEQVYNEFSSGTPDATAYRWLMKMFYERAKISGEMSSAPKYLLLFGRGTYDNRGLNKNWGDNLLLTYQADMSLDAVKSYVTDDYFGLLDDNEGSNVPANMVDIGIGRFPVVTAEHANDVVEKNISYMKNEIKGNWKNQLTFIADDGDDALHVRQTDSIAQTIFRANPDFQIQKIYLDSYLQEVSASGESYPLARKKLHGMINSGTLMLNFTGHASPLGWTNEQVLTKNDVHKDNMFNSKLPIWVAATCDFIQFDIKEISAGEMVVLNPTGGGIGMYSAARTVYAAQNERINRFFTEELFNRKSGKYPRLGDAVKHSKNSISTEINKLSYMLFGNPALKLNYPEDYKVMTEKINGNLVQEADTFRALSVNSIQGYLVDMNGNLASDFNGFVEVTIYDKYQRIVTLNNHNERNGAFPYYDRPNVLYSGKVEVSSGVFTFTFMLPKDIRYNYGTGRINYYANDTITGKEGQGHFENFIVGGALADVQYETDGPEIQMYLNTPNFVSGGKVNETPVFVAHLSDENGINTVGSGIGHDLKLVIDDDPYSTYILNEYFEADPGSYQKGRVRIKLPPMSIGKHTLTFHAFDMMNNSSQATLDFEVVEGLPTTIYSVKNYPNPVKTETRFVIEHDRPEVILEAKVEIFDLAGRLVFTKQQYNADNLKWDLKDNSGSRVMPGMYLYNVSLKTANSEFTSKANKIIVLGQ